MRGLVGLAVFIAALLGCTDNTATRDGGGGGGGDGGGGSGGGGGDHGPRPIPPPTFLPELPERLVALGDLHGDGAAMMRALALAGVIDAEGTWIGGETVVVQTGDQLDRGDDDRAILDYLETLADQAWQAGGAVYVLNGNHETLNVELYFDYVTPGAFGAFDELDPGGSDPLLDQFPAEQRGRAAAFRPGGVYAELLAGHNSMMQIGDTVFVHGGVLPAHLDHGLEGMNDSIRRWMRGEITTGHEDAIGGDGPLWVRDYSDGPDEAACTMLDEVLTALGASRMVVGHTVQDSINPDCGGKVWRIDVGMSAYYGGVASVLEIAAGQTTVLD